MSESGFLEVRGLSKCFGAVTALDGVDLSVGADELLVVLGTTGAGKTTLLRTLAGIETPDAGSIHMGGQDVTEASPASRDVALVFQNFSLYPDWTVRRNLEFPLRAPGRRWGAAEIDERVIWAARLLQIESLLDRPSTQLSGGEMQRVAIGRALVRRPRLFLMDEPLTNLDAKLREALRTELVRLRRELRTPMVYVTHDQAEALSMGDRIVVLNEGRVLQRGTPEDIYTRPVTPLVARQVGQPAINLFDAVRDGPVWCCARSGAALAPCRAPGASRATVGIRPEDVRLDPGDSAVVLLVEDMGAFRILRLDWGGLELHATTTATDLAAGARTGLRFNADRTLVWEHGEDLGGATGQPDAR